MPMHSGLADSVLVTNHITPRSSTGTTNAATPVDMQGYDGVMFIIHYGVFGTNGTLDALVNRDDNSGFNSAINISGAAITQIPAANANGLAIIDVWKPSERYVRCTVTGQANGVQVSVVAVQYHKSGIMPPTQGASQYVRVSEN